MESPRVGAISILFTCLCIITIYWPPSLVARGLITECLDMARL
ncbi:putative membrane protein [Proteus mirabilis]|nr:putative membrane protein [Proteus mirabilis]